MGSWCHGHPHALSLRILCPVRHPLVSLRLWALGLARVLVVGWPHSSRSVRCRRLFTSVEVLGQPSPGRFPGVLSYGAGRLLLYLEVDVTSGHGGPRSAPASSLTVSPHSSVHPVSRPVLFSRSGVLDVFPRVCPATERKREGEKEREKEREEERKCLGAKTARAVPHGGASGTAAPGGARRLDLGRQRKPPTIWSWRGWSGCAQPKQRGAAFTTSTEFGAGLSWRGAKGWSSSTFPSARLRARTREGAAAKRLRHARCVAWWLRLWGTWLLEGRGGPRCIRRHGQFTRWPQSRCQNLAPGTHAGIFLHRRLWHTPCTMQLPARIGRTRSGGRCFSSRVTRSKRSMLRRPNRRNSGGNGRRKHTRVRQAQHMVSPRLASTTARSVGWLGRSYLSSNWEHGCRCGWTGAGR